MSAAIHHRFLGLLLFFVSGLVFESHTVADSPGGHVYLSGQVHQQCAIEIPAGGKLTVTQAIISCGGFGDYPDMRKIRILRRNNDGSSQFINVDWVEIMGGGPADKPAEPHLDKDVVLQPGDVVTVPQRLINK